MTKNDCERNATRRWLKQFRREHPHLPVIVVEDALSSNAPASARPARGQRAHFILGVKPGDHAFLFDTCEAADEAGRTQTLTSDRSGDRHSASLSFCNDVPLNESNPDVLVNVLEYWEIHPDGNAAVFQLDHRLAADTRRTFAPSCGRSSPLEDRERNLQHPEKPRLSISNTTSGTASRTCRWCSPC